MMINVSTLAFIFATPSAAYFPRLGPSKLNGRVTTPTVNAPESFAIFATIGAAPLPVPPPIPAVTNTISAPASASANNSSLSSAALAPISGLDPAPKPRVNLGPSWIFVSAAEASKA